MTAPTEDLIARLVAGEPSSRQLDREVWLACGMNPKWGGPFDAAMKGIWEGPHVTHSADDALALAESVGLLGSVVIEAGTSGKAWVVGWRDREGLHYGPTPALALCLAILRARSALTGSA